MGTACSPIRSAKNYHCSLQNSAALCRYLFSRFSVSMSRIIKFSDSQGPYHTATALPTNHTRYCRCDCCYGIVLVVVSEFPFLVWVSLWCLLVEQKWLVTKRQAGKPTTWYELLCAVCNKWLAHGAWSTCSERTAAHCCVASCVPVGVGGHRAYINPLDPELDIYSLAHHLCKMWIF